ncbi:hypothetical protein FACS1894152_7700 [Bacilli bacterium]|nr:hypothetical protein FACS1894152_7700 [Bacilli bacterium]
MSDNLELMSRETKIRKSDIIRNALSDILEDYFIGKNLVSKIEEEWARDNFKTYPLEDFLAEHAELLEN